MAKTNLPSWVKHAPQNLGCLSHGKIMAEQWHTACLINLIITLCRIWGKSGTTAKDTVLLWNYLSLMIMIHWATICSVMPTHISIIKDHFVYYTQSIATIFREKALVVNNHAFLHTPECLQAFRPAHGRWAFPFEWFNGIIQQLNTNHKIGEFKVVILSSCCFPLTMSSFEGKWKEHLWEHSTGGVI